MPEVAEQPPGSGTGLPGSFPRCGAAASVEAACEGVADDLVALGLVLPSVYLLGGWRLRCYAARGYFQVVDGFAPGAGVIGKVVASGRADFVADVSTRSDFICAVPGLVAEVCAPVRCDGAVIGAISVESFEPLDPAVLGVVEGAAAALGGRITRLGGVPRPSPAQRLARVSVELSQATEAEEIEALALRAAAEISGMTSAVIAHVDCGRAWTSSVHGVLGEQLAHWGRSELEVLAAWVSHDTSSHFPGGADVPSGYEFLHRIGIRSISVHPLVVAGSTGGMLIVVSEEPVAHSPTVVDCLALLAAQTAGSLAMATLLRDASQRADQDDLTGLGNRALLEANLTAALGTGDPTGVLLLDLDDFKHVNDSHGHLVGDQLLVVVSDRIAGCLRDGDLAYRLGGDEFVVVLRLASEEVAINVAERLLAALRRPLAIDRCELATSASIGIALSGSTVDRILSDADGAMYAAKHRGKGCWALAVSPAETITSATAALPRTMVRD